MSFEKPAFFPSADGRDAEYTAMDAGIANRTI